MQIATVHCARSTSASSKGNKHKSNIARALRKPVLAQTVFILRLLEFAFNNKKAINL